MVQLSDADLNSAAQKFQETYSADIDSDFVAEVRSFRREFQGEIETSMCSLLCNLTDFFLYNNTRWVVCAILKFTFTKNLNALN